jgi:hypothetical protein
MEVHQHTHTAADPDSHRSRKKWTHYFWEFLMLFLAVTLGFFVENQREHYVENKRIKKYMQVFVNDLKSDIDQIKDDILVHKRRYRIMDSVIYLFQSTDMKQHTSQLYLYSHKIIHRGMFVYNDRTIQQLKTSGNLRLIKNDSISDSIMGYDHSARYIQKLDEIGQNFVQPYMELKRKIFDGFVMQEMISDTSATRPPNDNPPLRNNDPDVINEFIAHIQFMKSDVKRYINNMNIFLEKMNNLLSLIIKEYQVD